MALTCMTPLPRAQPTAAVLNKTVRHTNIACTDWLDSGGAARFMLSRLGVCVGIIGLSGAQ